MGLMEFLVIREVLAAELNLRIPFSMKVVTSEELVEAEILKLIEDLLQLESTVNTMLLFLFKLPMLLLSLPIFTTPPTLLFLPPSIMLFTMLFNTMDLMETPMDMMSMSNLIHSTLNMEFMMITTTLTSESQEKVMAMETFMENMKFLFLMAESSMFTIVLMVTMVVLSWMLSTRERPDTQSPMEDTMEVTMLNMEQLQLNLTMNKKIVTFKIDISHIYILIY